MSAEACYCCAEPGTTREHVPPLCIFPEKKDSTDGSSYRDGLITVPSCPSHNTVKSKDDEYLLCILALNVLNNPIGEQQARTKVLRALKRSPGLEKLVLSTHLPVMLENVETGVVDSTAALWIDTDRFMRVLSHVSKALYFHHCRIRWLIDVTIYPEFLVSMTGPDPKRANSALARLTSFSNGLFSRAPKIGMQPKVFYYQAVEKPDRDVLHAFRLTFYEGSQVTVLFGT